jgi:predicted nucleic acid-binding protein
MALVVDAGAFVAAANHRDPRHHDVAGLLQDGAPLVTTQIVLAEVDHLLTRRGGVDLEVAFLDALANAAIRAECLSAVELGRAREVVAQYRDLEVGLADASLVVLCARLRTRTLVTLDERCFRAMSPLNGGHFTLLPADTA